MNRERVWIKDRKVGQELKHLVWLLPSISGVTIFWLLPFLKLIKMSFFRNYDGAWVGMENYKMVLENESFRLAFANTFRFIIICIPLMSILSLLLAILLSEVNVLNLWIKQGILLPLLLPTVAVSLLFAVLFDKNGFLNVLMDTNINWIKGEGSFGVLIFVYIWKYVGMYVLIWLSGIMNVPRELKEASFLDGAGRLQYVRYMLLPNLKQVGFVCFVFMFINVFKVFREVYLMTGNYPHSSIYMIQHIFNNWFLNLSIDKLSAGAMMIATIILTFLFGIYWVLNRGNE